MDLGGIARKGGEPEAAAAAPAPFDPGVLRADPDDPRGGLAAAIFEGNQGALEGGVERLAGLEAGADPDLRGRIERERERMERLGALRVRVLTEARDKGTNLVVKKGRRTFSGTIEGIEQGILRLKDLRGKVREVPCDAFDPWQLANWTIRKKVRAPKWLVGYAYLLGGDPTAARGWLDPSLEKDAESYADWLREGEAISRLAGLSRLPLPASVALGRKFDEEGDPLRGLHGKIEKAGGDAIRITYRFESPAELDDFVEGDFLQGIRVQLAPLDTEASGSGVRIGQGGLLGAGDASWTHLLEWAAPYRVEYDLTYEIPSGILIRDESLGDIITGTSGEGPGCFSACLGLGTLIVQDVKGGHAYAETRFHTILGDSYRIEIRNDGSAITTSLDGKEAARAECGSRTRGAICFRFHTDVPIVMHHLTIEGKVTEGSLHRLRDRWVDRRLRELLQSLEEQD